LIWDIIRDYILANKDLMMCFALEKVNHPKVVGMNDNPGMADYPGESA
jgi:sulfur-oxidizing protein SoxB